MGVEESWVVFMCLHMVHWQLIRTDLLELPSVSELASPGLAANLILVGQKTRVVRGERIDSRACVCLCTRSSLIAIDLLELPSVQELSRLGLELVDI